MIDKGVFTPSTARQYLTQQLAEWVEDRQTLLILSGESPTESAYLGQVEAICLEAVAVFRGLGGLSPARGRGRL